MSRRNRTSPRKYLSPRAINIITCIAGIVFIVVPIILLKKGVFNNDAYDYVMLFVGFGTSLMSMGLINFLWELRVSNRVLKTVTDATMHAWGFVNKMRYNQRVEITFSTINFIDSNGNADYKVVADVLHLFKYKGEFPFSMKSNLEIYSITEGMII